MNHGNILVKVYGHVWPAPPVLLTDLRRLLDSLPPGDMPVEEALELDGDLLRISYEGIYFPLDDALHILTPHLGPQSQGKIDYLDLEAWTLTRCRVCGQGLERSSAPLNAVLDYSGH